MRHPALLPAVTLLTGVAVGWGWPFLFSFIGPVRVFAGVSWAGAVALLFLDKRRSVTAVASASFVAVGLLLGAQAASDATTTRVWQWHQHQRATGARDDPVAVEGRLRRDAVRTEYGASLDLLVERLRTRSGWVNMGGGLRVTVGGALAADGIEDWVQGRTLRMPVTVRPAARYLNPGVPDQERALMWRGTSLVGSVKSRLLPRFSKSSSTQ